MIFGIGIDLIEVMRIKKNIAKENFTTTIFSKKEIEYCSQKKFSEQHYAARFAAKEAFFKAIGTGWRGGLSFKEIETINDELGRPILNFYGKTKEFLKKKRLDKIHVSLTHLKAYAGAVVIIEKNE